MVERLKFDNPFKELKDTVWKTEISIWLIKSIWKQFRMPIDTLKKKDVANLFAQNPIVDRLTREEKLSTDDIHKLEIEVIKVLKTYKTNLEKISKKQDKIKSLDIINRFTGLKPKFKKIGTIGLKTAKWSWKLLNSAFEYKHKLKLAMICWACFIVANNLTNKSEDAKIIKDFKEKKINSATYNADNFSQQKIKNIDNYSEQKIKIVSSDLNSKEGFKDFCKNVTWNINSINDSSKIRDSINVPDKFVWFLKNLSNNLDWSNLNWSKINEDTLKTFLILSKERLQINLENGKYDNSYKNDIAKIEQLYNITEDSVNWNWEYVFRLKDNLWINILKSNWEYYIRTF